jgi:hypothetical protein
LFPLYYVFSDGHIAISYEFFLLWTACFDASSLISGGLLSQKYCVKVLYWF